jgi:hypothetical protein
VSKPSSSELETPVIRTLDLAELETVSGGEVQIATLAAKDALLTNKDVIEIVYGVKWPIGG